MAVPMVAPMVARTAVPTVALMVAPTAARERHTPQSQD